MTGWVSGRDGEKCLSSWRCRWWWWCWWWWWLNVCREIEHNLNIDNLLGLYRGWSGGDKWWAVEECCWSIGGLLRSIAPVGIGSPRQVLCSHILGVPLVLTDHLAQHLFVPVYNIPVNLHSHPPSLFITSSSRQSHSLFMTQRCFLESGYMPAPTWV